MAKTSKKRNKKSKKKSFWNDERFKLVLGIFVLFFSVSLLIAFISYFFTWKIDQSFEFQKVFSNSTIKVENWAGKFGAHFSLLFITKGVGIAAFSIPFFISLIGFRLLNVRLLPLRKTFRTALLSTIITSVVLGYIFGNQSDYLGNGLGGKHGFFIAEWFKALIGNVGTGIFLFVVVFIFLILNSKYLENRIKQLFSQVLPKSENTQEETIKEEVVEEQPVEKEEVKNQDLVFETEFAENSKESYDGMEVEKPKEEETYIEPQPTVNEVTPKNESDEELNFTVSNKDFEEASGNMDNFQEQLEDYDPTLDLEHYKLPSLDILEDHSLYASKVSDEELISNKNKIVETLSHYKIQIDKIKATIGPTITLYEIVPAPGIRISKIKNLEDDIALSLAALGIRIIAPMPGKGTIGIEVPNQNPDIVSMLSILSSRKFQESKHELPVALGKTISNETYIFDLTKMPHLLVAGATGQGKSVGLNAIIASLLYKKHPSQLKVVMIDPKKVELTLYSRIEKHYLAKLPDEEEAIVTDTQKVIYTLNSLTIEMDNRYDLLKKAHVRNIKEYNAKFIKRSLNPNNGHKYLPYIVVFIDEFADLIMTAGREIENPLGRLAQLARAIGIHLVIATQRPTTNIITGVIKANFPARIAFRVTSGVDSKTILDSTGANQLIGRGDMLISNGSDMVRVQCAFIDIPELEKLTSFIGEQQSYPTAFMLPEYEGEAVAGLPEVELDKRDDLFDDAARLLVQNQQGSTSLIQRKFSIGYNRAGRIMDQLEAAGIVGPNEGSKARSVLFPDEYSLEQYLNDLN
jgi:S-DNA-T family DNA segregation ATPase FtsK/SpoIIIE